MSDLAKKNHKRTLQKRFEPYAAYLWLAPTIIMVTIFVLAPVVNTFILAFSEVSKAGLVKGFGTLENFEFLFKQPVLPRVMFNTIFWVIVIVAISMVLSLALAVALNQEFKGRKFVRSVLLLPWATSQFIFACAWRYIFNYEYGPLNTLLLRLGVLKEGINWLAEADLAMVCMIYVGILVTIPFMTFTLMSGLTSISHDYYEAARIDGASAWQRFTRITLPLLKPSINVTIVLNTIYVFNSFTIVNTITGGAPANQSGTVMTYLYYLAFQKHRYGAASALSVIGFIILLIFSIIYMKTQMKEEL